MPPLCERCILPGDATNVSLDAQGVCSLCRAYDRLAPGLTDFPRLQRLRAERLAAAKGKSRYDALVGLSGGKDSSYVAYKLARAYGLRLLIVTYDNGFLSEAARGNIDTVVKALGQEHRFVSPSPALNRAICRSSLRLYGVPCLGCTFPGFAACIKIAVDEGIPLLVHGRSRAQMFKDLAPGAVDPHLPFLEGNLRPPDPERNRRFLLATARKLKFALRGVSGDPRFAAEAARLFAIDTGRLAALPAPPEFLGYFLYEKQDEARLGAELRESLGWKKPEGSGLYGHADCKVHPAAAYLYAAEHGYPLLQQELAVLVREGALARAEALALLAADRHGKELCPEAMEELARFSGVPAGRILGYARRAGALLRILRAALRLRNRLFPGWPARRPPLGGFQA